MASRMDFFMVPREIFSPESFAFEAYTRREALLDLIQMAAYEPKRISLVGGERELQRGQLAVSVRFLSARWGWGKDKVSRVLNEFEKRGFIGHESDTVTTIISIRNYDSYQGQSDTSKDTVADTVKDTDADKYKNIRIKEKRNNTCTKVHSHVDAVERLYALYPSSVVRSGGNRVSLKSSKDKSRIATLLKTRTEEEIAGIMQRYLDENPGAYTKMLSTFLNNLPDYNYPELSEQPQPQTPEKNNKPTFTFAGTPRG